MIHILNTIDKVEKYIPTIILIMCITSEILNVFRFSPVCLGIKVAVDMPKECLKMYQLGKV